MSLLHFVNRFTVWGSDLAEVIGHITCVSSNRSFWGSAATRCEGNGSTQQKSHNNNYVYAAGPVANTQFQQSAMAHSGTGEMLDHLKQINKLKEGLQKITFFYKHIIV